MIYSVIGTFVGAAVYSHIPSSLFKYIVYAYIGVSGVIVFLTA